MKTINGGSTHHPLSTQIMLVLAGTAAIVLTLFLTMQVSSEMAWSLFDFALIGVLLAGIGTAFVVAARFFNSTRQRIVVGLVFAGALLLIWAELAVGIFGSPFAGS